MQNKRRVRPQKQESFFPDRDAFEVFLEEVQRTAHGCDVAPKNITYITKVLRRTFGKGLPRETRNRHRKVA